MELTRLGWVCLLAAVAGEVLVPLALAPFYQDYRHSTMAVSLLGSPSSPVRVPFNLFMLAAGLLYLLALPALYRAYCGVSPGLAAGAAACVGAYAVGACVFTCFFPVEADRELQTVAGKLHGAGSAIGFMALLAVPLLLCLVSRRAGDKPGAVAYGTVFVLALGAFVLFVLSDKESLKDSWVAKEGLWQRVSLYLMLSAPAWAAWTHLRA